MSEKTHQKKRHERTSSLSDGGVDEQAQAIESILKQLKSRKGQEVLLGGWAGTGKTYSLGTLVRRLVALQPVGRSLRIGACAPTHAAVAELSSKLRSAAPNVTVVARTAASMLGMRMRHVARGQSVLVPLPVSKRSKSRRYFRDYDVMLVDECGMLDALYIDSIRAECKANPRLHVLYAGDPGQLLPISSSADKSTLSGLGVKRVPPIFEACQQQFILKTNRRTHEASFSILEVAQVFRDYIDGQKTGVVTVEEVVEVARRDQQKPHRSVFLLQGRQKRIESAARAVRAGGGKPEFSRILAYRNSVVQEDNLAVHRSLVDFFNPPAARRDDPFWTGEVALANEFFAAWTECGLERCLRGEEEQWIEDLSDDIEDIEDPREDTGEGAGRLESQRIVLVENNTRLDILEVEPMLHPVLKIACWLVCFRCFDETAEGENQPRLYGFLPKNPSEFESIKTRAFADYRVAREAEEAQSRGRDSGSPRQASSGLLLQVSRDASFALSRRMWMVSRSCAPIRHSYAMTFHKAQGSTLENVFLNWSDARHMLRQDPSGTDYHRALYVGATRAARKLVLCFD